MTDNAEKEINQAPASEVAGDTGSVAQPEQQQARQVPLEALEAERHKRQELEAQNRILQDYALRYQQQQQEQTSKQRVVDDEDETDLVNKRDLKKFHEKITKEELAVLKREIAEDTFKEVNPEAIKQINLHLKEILDRRPWLASSIEEAPNRYARAYEIVQDYAPTLAAKKTSAVEAQKIVENSKKPGSPVTVGKSANMSQTDYLKSIAGKKEFREYRQKLLQG